MVIKFVVIRFVHSKLSICGMSMIRSDIVGEIINQMPINKILFQYIFLVEIKREMTLKVHLRKRRLV